MAVKRERMNELQQKWALTRPIPSDTLTYGKFGPVVVAAICENLSTGAGVVEACAAAGVSHSRYKAWLRAGREDPESVYGEFLDLVEQARAQAELRLLRIIDKAANEPKNWTAAAWLLERSRPERWSLANRVAVTGEVQHRIVFEFAKAKPNDNGQNDNDHD